MKNWNAEFDYNIRTGGSMTFAADTRDEAEQLAYDYVQETYPDAFDIEVVEVDEIVI
jgi:hypothetical protein